MRAINMGYAVLTVAMLMMISLYIIPPQILNVEETEEVEIDGITVDMPTKYMQLPTLRMGLPFRMSMYCGHDDVATQLAQAIDEPNRSISHRATLVSLFVSENIEYANDRYEEWKLPWETVRDGCGDCEDMAILAHSMLLAMNIDAVVAISLHHAMVAVNTGEMDGYGVWHDGKWYQLMEIGHAPGSVEHGTMYLTMNGGFSIYCLITVELYILLLLMLLVSYFKDCKEKRI